MRHRGVRHQKQTEKQGTDGTGAAMSLAEGIAKVKELANVKADRTYKGGKKRKSVDQTIELVVHLGIDPKQAEQALRGAVSLPKGIGKTKKVIAFCEGELAEKAKAAGAMEAGIEELIEKINGGWLDFDVAIAHPSAMGKVSKLGRTLGPIGKMPTPKGGTVTPEVESAVRDFAAGKVEYRNDAGGNLHVVVGKASFQVEDLQENIESFMGHVHKIKPASSKGQYIKNVCLCGTMTPSVKVDLG